MMVGACRLQVVSERFARSLENWQSEGIDPLPLYLLLNPDINTLSILNGSS